ncbi:MAG: DJ-1/PfpI family protein [Oscillospiraceae bacterium]|nr:DJ-1/PfpI family protein [Oscillospiraceae bacterium]
MVYLLLGKGFEEIEAITPVDVLRRCGVEVQTAGIGGLEIEGGHGVVVRADCRVEDIDQEKLEMIVVPGGLGGVASIQGSEAALRAIRAARAAGKYVAAICAGPSVLGGLGLLQGRRATCYPGVEGQLTGAVCEDGPVVVDGKLITSRGPGTSAAFALALAEALCGGEAAAQTAKGMLVR